MGRRGPQPKTPEQKKLEGVHRKWETSAAAPPESKMSLPAGAPQRPEWLSATARRIWDRVVPQLAAIRILSDVDAEQLANYCDAQALVVKLSRQLEREGTTVVINKTKEGKGGQKVPNPTIHVLKEARAEARRLAREYGLTAASRASISNPSRGDDLLDANERMAAAGRASDEAEKFIFRDRGLKLVKVEISSEPQGPQAPPSSPTEVSDTKPPNAGGPPA